MPLDPIEYADPAYRLALDFTPQSNDNPHPDILLPRARPHTPALAELEHQAHLQTDSSNARGAAPGTLEDPTEYQNEGQKPKGEELLSPVAPADFAAGEGTGAPTPAPGIAEGESEYKDEGEKRKRRQGHGASGRAEYQRRTRVPFPVAAFHTGSAACQN